MRIIKKNNNLLEKAANKNATIEDLLITDSKLIEHKIVVRLGISLIDTLKNIVASNKIGGNYEYTTVSDILRKSLDKYMKGMKLIAQRTNDNRKETSFRVSKELKDFYLTLPASVKSEIVERAVNTFIKYEI